MYKEIFERKPIDGGKNPETVSFLFSTIEDQYLTFYSTKEQGHCKVFPKQALKDVLNVLKKYEAVPKVGVGIVVPTKEQMDKIFIPPMTA